jgi:hypothetical protein
VIRAIRARDHAGQSFVQGGAPTPSFRRRPESHFNSEAGHRTSALQQRSQPSPQPFATTTAIPAFAGMTRKTPHTVISAKAGIALQQRSWSSHFGSSTTKPAIPPALRNSNCDPCLRRDDEQNPPHRLPAKAGGAFQQRSWSSHFSSPTTKPAIPQPFATTTAIPAFAGMTSKPTTSSFRRRPESHFNSEAGHRASALQRQSQPSPPALRNNNCDPCLRRDDEQNPQHRHPGEGRNDE